ncbi:MAG: hypothetical protein ACQER9_04800 [Nanobdellota archaeon]
MEENNSEETKQMNLGDKIVLKGFNEEAGSNMIIVKKIVGNHVKKIMDSNDSFKNIEISLKKVHAHEENGKKEGKNELHVKVEADKMYNSEVVDFNLFVAVDKAMKKIFSEMKL